MTSILAICDFGHTLCSPGIAHLSGIASVLYGDNACLRAESSCSVFVVLLECFHTIGYGMLEVGHFVEMPGIPNGHSAEMTLMSLCQAKDLSVAS